MVTAPRNRRAPLKPLRSALMGLLAIALFLLIPDTAAAYPGETSRVSVGISGQANGGSLSPAISADGRFVAFESFASNLVPEDTNGAADVFLHDSLASADKVGCPNEASANGAAHANQNSAHGAEKQAARDCSG